MAEEEEVSHYEQTVLTANEVFVYKVPPLRTASGHRAEDWGLDKPVFTGAMKIFQTEKKLRIVIYRFNDPTTVLTTPENLTAFAECHIEVKPKEDITGYVDAVIDSSRYYVLRIQDPKNPTRSVHIGVGFRERDTSFDFKNALNDYVRFIDRMALADQMAHMQLHEEDAEHLDKNGPIKPHRDLSLKEGDKIKVAIKSKRHPPGAPTTPNKTVTGLRPPPPPGATVFASIPLKPVLIDTDLDEESSDSGFKHMSQEHTHTQEENKEDNIWGDFEFTSADTSNASMSGGYQSMSSSTTLPSTSPNTTTNSVSDASAAITSNQPVSETDKDDWGDFTAAGF